MTQPTKGGPVTIEESNGNWVGIVSLTREELAAIVAAVKG